MTDNSFDYEEQRVKMLEEMNERLRETAFATSSSLPDYNELKRRMDESQKNLLSVINEQNEEMERMRDKASQFISDVMKRVEETCNLFLQLKKDIITVLLTEQTSECKLREIRRVVLRYNSNMESSNMLNELSEFMSIPEIGQQLLKMTEKYTDVQGEVKTFKETIIQILANTTATDDRKIDGLELLLMA